MVVSARQPAWAMGLYQAQRWIARIRRETGQEGVLLAVADNPSLQECGWAGGYYIVVTNRRGERESLCNANQARLFLVWASAKE